ncbi:MAG: FAD-dependent monooxygenase [Sandarakinorhabdus sp.]|nr:FAD-dependent monooxygenase [Sandarakinorhabdus sp.]
MIDYDVIVAGGGPVGTVAGYALARAGLKVLVVEADSHCAEDLRASTFHPSSLEMLDKLGLFNDMLPLGLKAPVYQYRIRGTGEILAFDLGELADRTPFPFRLQYEQWQLAQLVAVRIAAMPGCDMAFSRRVVHFDQDEDGVTVHLEAPTEIETRRCRYLVAADGANSIVRKWLGVGFSGFTYAEKFLCLSTKLPLEDHFDRLAYVNYVADPTDWHVLLRVPRLWRVLVSADEATPDAALKSDANKSAIFDRLLGKDGADVETVHRTIYRVHQRVAERYDHGRVLLIGDAAHLNNPLGGLGMNSGIHDAINLAEKLPLIIHEGAEAAPLLARFDRQRRTVMHNFIQAQTIANKKLMEASDPVAREEYYGGIRDLNADPDRRREYMYTQAMFKSLDDAAAIH